MRVLVGILLVAIVAGCAELEQKKIDSSQMGEAQATLQIEAPDLAGFISIPLISSKVVNVELSRFSGCADGAQRKDASDELGKATLTPKETMQSVSIPAGVELAIFAESYETSAGSSYRCQSAVRFRSESGRSYILRFTPHRSMATIFDRSCNLEFSELRQGVKSPVASAHHAVVEDKGFWKGRELNLCAR